MSAKPSVPNRPLSPFMLGSYYRFQISSVLSFAHRLTGIALSIGSVIIAVWVLFAVAGPGAYSNFIWFAHTIIGTLLLIGWSWAVFYHLSNGIRHLVWDVGYGFEKSGVDLGGWLVLVASVVLTALAWIVAYLI